MESIAPAVEHALQARTRLAESVFELDGRTWCAEHTEAMDALVHAVYQASAGGTRPRVSVVATGGYGRRELALYSDIDITLVAEDDADPEVDRFVRVFFRNVQDAFRPLGIEVGYAYRLASDASGMDATSRTGLIDARLLIGSQLPLDALMDAFWRDFPVGDFLLAKLQERRASEAAHHDTPLVTEPHLKDGAGGLRSFQAANWIRLAIGERPMSPTEAYDTVLRWRNWLHATTGRKQDLLTRMRRGEIAERLGLDGSILSASLVQAMRSLAKEYERAVARINETRFSLGPAVEVIRGEARVVGGTSAGAAAVGIAMASQLGLQVSDLPVGTCGTIRGPEAIYALTRSESVLRSLDTADLLGQLLPELEATRTLMPGDSSHRFSVFEHSLRAIRGLDQLPPPWNEIRESVHNPRVLRMALLMHDLGKADPSGPHSQTGAMIVRRVGERWSLEPAFIEEVAWLVEHHMDLDHFARMRDVDHPETLAELANLVGTPDRLAMLTVLTYADVQAVAPGVLTPTQETFLRQLYERTSRQLQQERRDDFSPATYRRRLQHELRNGGPSAEALERFLASMPTHYLVSTHAETVALHFAYVERGREGQTTIEVFHPREIAASDVTICTPDQPGLLSRLLGVFYAFDLGVHGLRVSTAAVEPSVALDTFTLDFGGRPIPEATAAEVTHALREVIGGELAVDELLIRRGKKPDRKPEILSYHFHDGESSILDVQTPRERGMAFRLSRLITEAGWIVRAARVSQWAGRGTAAFYLAGPQDQRLSRADIEAVLEPQVK